MKTAVVEIAWLAGLIEGEGSFFHKMTPTVSIQMADADVINHGARICGVKPRNPYRAKYGNRLLVHHFVLCGARAIGWMMTLYPFMGQRRQSKIREVIAIWRASKRMPRPPRGEVWEARCGHPGRVSANFECHRCYMKRYRARTGRNGTYYRHRKALSIP